MTNSLHGLTSSYRPSGGPHHKWIVKSAEVIVYGGGVSRDSNGELVNATDTASTEFVGVALESVTGDGTKTALVDQGGCLSTVDHEDNLAAVIPGTAVYCEFNGEVTSIGSATNNILRGKIVEVLTTGAGTSTCIIVNVKYE